MNIGFDLDKIFINHPPFIPSWLIEKLYKEKSDGELLYRIPTLLEQKARQWSHHYLLRTPIKKNIEIVRKMINNKKNNYYLISSRFGFLQQQTNIIVAKYKLKEMFQTLYFNFDNQQPHLFKDTMIKKLKIEKYIDDDLPLLEYLAQKNPKTVFYWLNSKRNGPIKKNIYAITQIDKIDS